MRRKSICAAHYVAFLDLKGHSAPKDHRGMRRRLGGRAVGKIYLSDLKASAHPHRRDHLGSVRDLDLVALNEAIQASFLVFKRDSKARYTASLFFIIIDRGGKICLVANVSRLRAELRVIGRGVEIISRAILAVRYAFKLVIPCLLYTSPSPRD